jgi:hypothetical protein
MSNFDIMSINQITYGDPGNLLVESLNHHPAYLCWNLCSGRPACVGICAVAGQLVLEIVQMMPDACRNLCRAD